MPVIPNTSEVKIYSRNFIDRYSTITNNGSGTNAYLWDRDKNKKFVTSGKNDDTQELTVTIIFNENTTETEFIFNTLFLINTNAKDVKLEKWNDATLDYETIFQDEIPAGSTTRCWTFGNVESSRVRLTVTRTQKPNKEKEIGEMIVARLRHVMGGNPVTYNVHHREKKETIELANGEKHIAYTAFSGERISKYGASVSFEQMSQTDYNFLECLKNEGAPFLFYPEADTRDDEIYYVNWVNPFTVNYTVQFKPVGYSLTMELEEV